MRWIPEVCTVALATGLARIFCVLGASGIGLGTCARVYGLGSQRLRRTPCSSAALQYRDDPAHPTLNVGGVQLWRQICYHVRTSTST